MRCPSVEKWIDPRPRLLFDSRPSPSRQRHCVHCQHKEWHEGCFRSSFCNWRSYLPSCRIGASDWVSPRSVCSDAVKLGRGHCSTAGGHFGSGYYNRGPLGGNFRLPPLPWIHPRPRFVSQLARRRRHGDETQRRLGQHHHANWTLDIAYLPHLHSFADRGAIGGRCVENVAMLPVPKRQLRPQCSPGPAL